MYGVDLDRLLADDELNARLAWALVGLLCTLSVAEFAMGDPGTAAAVGTIALLAALPGPFYRSLSVTLPWEVVAVLAVLSGWLVVHPGPVVAALALAASGLVVAIEVHLFTPVRMTHRFAAAFAALATAAAAGTWAVAQWTSDHYLGTALLGSHDALLVGFVYAALAGVGAALAFDGYVRWWEGRLDRLTPLADGPGSRSEREVSAAGTGGDGEDVAAVGDDGSGDDERFRRPVLHDRHKVRLSRGMTACVAGVLVVSGVRGNVSVLLNAGLGLGVALAPVALVRDRAAAAGPGLSLWVTVAVFLHVVGAVEVPGFGTFYADLWWWDHLTHAASASLVAGLGYVVVRAVDEHTDALVVPGRYTVVVTLVIVLAVGVYWEVLEFAVGHVSVGGETALTQYGVGDTVEDLAFDALGGLVAAAVGFGHLAPLVGTVRDRLDG